MTGKSATAARTWNVSCDQARKNELLRVLHVLDPRYYTQGIPGGSGETIAPRTKKRFYRTRQSQVTRNLLRRHFALHFAQFCENSGF